MSVKRYEANGSSSVSEDANGSLVDYSDYVALEEKLAESQREFRSAGATNDNLQMKLEKMAAENAGLKTHGEAMAVDNAALREVVERMINQFAMSGISPEERSINPAKSLMFDAKSALFMPATDAFLAEVRASAVDEACLKISNAIVNCYQDEQIGLDEAATICGDFASELRKGVQS
ncbi:hypothetical protein DD604_03270 [Enterobacter cloacae]|uniref:hypothetical protein n=1 Tax=Enterobacter cloacae TaxID=550 RepID=UPI0010126739|nr:hypothetical protein [Enterobacter cloacae]RXX51347.1 hypothetical protein DD604_03270 [Enterobacter cloacae]